MKNNVTCVTCCRPNLSACALTICFLFVATNTSAQAIVETFEDATATTALSTGNTITINGTSTTTSAGAQVGTFSQAINASASTMSIGISESNTSSTSASGFSNVINIALVTALANFNSTTTSCYTSSATVSASTSGPSSTGTFTWYYGGNGAKITISSGTSGYHSNKYYVDMAQNNTFLITPTLPGGVAQVSFWMTNPGTNNAVKVGVRTNLTGSLAYPTDFNGATGAFSLNTSSFTVSNGMAATTASIIYSSSNVIILGSGAGYVASNTGTIPLKISQFVYNVPTSLQGSSAQLAFMVSSGSGADVYIDDIEIVSACVRNTWTGSVNSDWNTAGNWSCGVLPSAGANIVIPDVSPNAAPALSADVTVNNITINSAASLSLNGHTITINGILSGAGTYSGSATSSIIFNNTTAGTVSFTSGANTLQNLTIHDGANITLGSSLNIASTGIVSVGSTTGAILASNGNLTLVSDDNGSARIAAVPVNGSGISLSTISGNVNVQCYIHSNNSSVPGARRAFRMLTAPISNAGVSPASTVYTAWQNGGAYTPGVGTMITAPAGVATGGSGNGLDDGINANYSLQVWDPATQKLVNVNNTMTNISGTNGSADNLAYFIFIRGDRDPETINDPSVAIINNTTLSATGILQLGDQTFSSSTGIVATAANGLSLIGNPYASSIDFSMIAGDNAGNHTSYLNNLINRVYIWNANLTGTQGVGGYVCMDDAGYTGTYTRSIGATGSATAADLSLQSGESFFLQTQSAGPASVTFKEFAKNNTNNYIYRPADEEDIVAASGQTISATLSLAEASTPVDGAVAQFNDTYCDCVDHMDAPKLANPNEMLSFARNDQLLCIERRPAISKADTLFLHLDQLQQRAYKFSFAVNMNGNADLHPYLVDRYKHTHTLLNSDGSSTINFSVDADNSSQVANRFMVVFDDKKAIAGDAEEIKIYPNPVQNGQLNVVFNNASEGNYQYRIVNMLGMEMQSGIINNAGSAINTVVQLSKNIIKGTYQVEIIHPDETLTTIGIICK